MTLNILSPKIRLLREKTMQTRLKSSVITLAVALAGCSSVQVYKEGGAEAEKGIPFYIKIPVRTQETNLAERQLHLVVTVSQVLLQPGEAPKVLMSQDFPPSGPLRMGDTPAARAALDKFLVSIPEGATVTYEDTKAFLADDRIYKLVEAHPLLSPTPGNCAALQARLAVISNSWQNTMVVGPKVHYLTPKHPLFGTSSFDFEFGADGTLTKASGSVTDETAKTLLGLFPITAKLTKQWGLASEAAKSNALLSAKVRKTLADSDSRLVVRVEATTTAITKVYTLRSQSAVPTAAAEQAVAPLGICAALNGNGAQLVSVADAGAQKGEKSDDAASWKLQGTATPPKEADK